MLQNCSKTAPKLFQNCSKTVCGPRALGGVLFLRIFAAGSCFNVAAPDPPFQVNLALLTSTGPGQSNRARKNTVSGVDEVSECESMDGEQPVVVKKTVRFKKLHRVIRGDMGLTDRRRRTIANRADTLLLCCRDGCQPLQGLTAHEGIMELTTLIKSGGARNVELACANTL